jgi:hypothetical protein
MTNNFWFFFSRQVFAEIKIFEFLNYIIYKVLELFLCIRVSSSFLPLISCYIFRFLSQNTQIYIYK